MTRRRYRVAHVITRLDLGGAQQNTLYSLAHHDRSRFECELVAGRGGLLDADALALAETRVSLFTEFKHPIAPAWDALALARLTAHFRSRRPDVVHTHSSKAGLLGRLAAHLAGVPVIVHTVHGWSFNATQPAWLRAAYVALERWAAGLTGQLVTVSRRDRERGLALGIGSPGRYTILHSGIEIARFETPDRPREAVRRELGIAPDELLVGGLACLKPQKEPLDFIRAAARAHERDPRLRFVLAGDGELRADAERLIEASGLGAAMRLLGWRRDVVDLLHAMDLFLLVSRFEGLPRAVLQAMAAGVPVVATAVDGTPEVVRDGETGLLVPPGQPEAAADALVGLAADPAQRRRLAAQARRGLDRRFDIRRMVGDLDRLYLSLLERPGA